MFYKSRLLLILLITATSSFSAEFVAIVSPHKHVARIAFGIEKINSSFNDIGIKAVEAKNKNQTKADKIHIVGT